MNSVTSRNDLGDFYFSEEPNFDQAPMHKVLKSSIGVTSAFVCPYLGKKAIQF